MRAAAQPHPSVRPVLAHVALTRAMVALLATVALLLVWSPTVARAQAANAAAVQSAPESVTRLHVVTAGETLWGLAERYYGDGREWHTLASRNDIPAVASKPLPAGRKLLIPARPNAAPNAEAVSAPTLATVHAPTVVATPDKKVAEAPAKKVADTAVKKVAAAPAKKAVEAPAKNVAETHTPKLAATPARKVATAPTHLASATRAKKLTPAPAPKPPTVAAAREASRGTAAVAEPGSPAVVGSLASQTSGTHDAAPVRSARTAVSKVRDARVTPRVVPGPTSVTVDASVAATPREVAADWRMAPPTTGHLGIGSSSPTDTDIARPPTRIGLVTQADLAAARGKNETATVFIRYVPEQAELDASARAISARKKPAWRRGEYEAAPFAVHQKSLALAGRIVRRVGAAADGSLGGLPRMLLADEVEISAPAGAQLQPGDRLISVNVDRQLTADTRVAIPSGVLIVTRADPGKPVMAIVQRQSAVIEQGQLLYVDAAAYPMSEVVAEPTVGIDVETRVLWVGDLALSPSLQSFVLLSAGHAQGVKAGDQFALVKRTGVGTAAREERVAVARVVRTGPDGSTAIIVRQSGADIASGEPAFRIARAP